jgi:hypothetical protein
MQSRHSRGSIARLFLDIVAAGAGVIGQAPFTAIQRKADGLWFQASDGTWVPTPVNNPMTQTDSVNMPGRYHFDFNQTLDLLSSSTEYSAKKFTSSGTLALDYEDLVFGPLAGVIPFGMCSIQGAIADIQGGPARNSVVRATIIPVFTDSLGRGVQYDMVAVAHTNDSGDFDLPLVRGAICRLEIVDIGYDRKITVPDQASVLFSVL